MMRIKQQIGDPLYRNSLFLMTNTVVTTGLGFFFWMVVARFYEVDEVGLGAAIISAASFLALFSRLGLDYALIRFLPKAERPAEMINSCYTICGLVALVVAGVFIAGLDLWSPALGFIRENAVFAVAFVLFAAAWTLSMITDFTFVAKRRTEFALTKNTIFSLLKIPLPVVLVLFFRSFGIVSSWGIAVAIALGFSLFLFLPRIQEGYRPLPRLNVGAIKGVWRYSTGSYFAALFSAAPQSVLPIMIVNRLGAEQNAYFYVGWMIASVLFAIPLAVSQSLFAEGSHFEDRLQIDVQRSIRFILLLLVPATAILFLAGKWFLLLFGASYSENALDLLRILSASSLLVGANNIYISILRVENRIGELVVLSGFTTVAVLLASYLIMPATGITGTAYAWIATQGAICIYVLPRLRPRYGARENPERSG